MAELRITGGELRGRRIAAPGRGEKTRPTSERVREAAFSILGSVEGARVLDLFCGTGALAFEALSRGAAAATLVDTRTRTARANAERLGVTDRARVVRSAAAPFLSRVSDRGRARGGIAAAGFDLVLCDPPYDLPDRDWERLAPPLAASLAEGGRLMLECAAARPLAVALPLLRERRYGDTMLRLYGAGEGA
ncbi:MAG: RsmD family RNA methyltransferase [Solirubrobacterales bacterium]